jgi:hypothetical protein
MRRKSSTVVNVGRMLLPILLIGASIFPLPDDGKAADTVETWDMGATDVDFYTGFDGIGERSTNRTVYSDIMLGYGIIDRLSAYVGTTLQGNEFFGDSQARIYLGVFGTSVDTDHFNLDLFLDISAGGPALSEFRVAPAVELNYDLDSELRSWGAYLQLGMPVYGVNRVLDTSDDVEYSREFSIEIKPGIYLTLAERHQILFEYDMTYYSRSEDGHPVDIGGVALGYNVKLSEGIEMINQVYLNVPQQDEAVTAGLMTGFIATLPSKR